MRGAPRLYLPPRNIVGSLVPITIIAWYYVDKADSAPVKFIIIAAAALLQLLCVLVSARTRTTRRPFFWRIYDLLTGNGRLPLRLFSFGIGTIVVLAVGFEILGLQRGGGSPESFISRFVEVDVYWTLATFLGISIADITPLGYARILTVVTTICGMLFWGMYISVLVNKHLRLADLAKKRATLAEMDKEHYNE